MKPLRLDIIYPKGLTKTLTKVGLGLLLFGMGLIFLVLTNDWEFFRTTPNILYVFGVGPAVIGFAITGIIQVTNPSEKVGSVTLTKDDISIVNDGKVSKILLEEVSGISLEIEGYEMQAKKPRWLYYNRVQSNYYGDNNHLTIKLKNGNEMTTQFFLTNEKVESYLRQRLTELSVHHGFKLTSN
jgi:hypothetical protein